MFENFNWIEAVETSPVMQIILVLSVLTFGFALERAIYYWKRRGNADRALASILVAVRAGDREDAIRRCGETAHPLGAVAAELLRCDDATPDATEERLQIALSEQRLELERNLGFLGTMGNTAPLVGLLGTVWGIMRAFHDMARTGSAGPSVVAAGVAEALLTTACGLLIAVPAVMIYNHFVRRMVVMLTIAENHARTIRMATNEPGTGNHRSRKAA